ncbi:hypothetical protein B0T25DRAFT_208840 [Lasiosphaeria hispida]|uniref:Uncharacterized protein n=1 Tax=Lasiosphaeria hispida TaxID=260671 RepID=A0AAJ0MEC8_9PEZI|nr:hypothetical protein B0T25DRAFT_208840 [Lasiosphaeria hispida]
MATTTIRLLYAPSLAAAATQHSSRAGAIPAGAPRPSAEGKWNCLTTPWQRCGPGRWSPVMPAAARLTYDFRVDYAGHHSEAPGAGPDGPPPSPRSQAGQPQPPPASAAGLGNGQWGGGRRGAEWRWADGAAYTVAGVDTRMMAVATAGAAF